MELCEEAIHYLCPVRYFNMLTNPQIMLQCEETQAQRIRVPCPMSHSQEVELRRS